MWAQGKLAAVRDWAAAAGVDLAESYAYSDSVFDTPLLSAVGNPVVVNPDPSMVVMATLRRWPVRHFDVSPGVFKIPVLGIELQRVLQQFARPQLMPYARFDIDGIENIPKPRPRHPRDEPPQLLRRRGDVDRHRSQRSGGALPRQEGGVRRPGGRTDRLGDGRHPGRAGQRVDRATARRCRGARGGRARHRRSAGNDPSRQGVLRPGAQGALGCRPAAPAHRRTDDPDRHVGHREGLAAVESTAQRAQHHRPADGADSRRAADSPV